MAVVMVVVLGPTTSGEPALEYTQLLSGAGLLPATNPPEIAKAGALLLAPVKVPIPISVATLVPRALLGAVATVAPPALVVMLLMVVVVVVVLR
jgi:hypothetical protein